jgi:hypothetical protein
MIDTSNLQQIPGCFPAFIQGADILVVDQLVTAFGGVQDCESGADDGHTESGVDTAVQNPDGSWTDTGALGCALPCRSIEWATQNSPFAWSGPHLPWNIQVKFWQGDQEPETLPGQNTFPLLDNGPETQKFPNHTADLTKFAAALFSTMDPAQLTSAFGLLMNYRVIGGAQWVTPR